MLKVPRLSIQFIIQAILVFLGLVVDLMPGIDVWWPSIMLYSIAGVLFLFSIYYYFRHKNEIKEDDGNEIPELSDIIPVLQKMNDRILYLAYREAKRLFNPLRFLLVVNELDEDYFKEIENLKNISAFLDSKEYGLKRRRNKDKEYKHYKSIIDNLKNTNPDDDLSEFIKDHIEYSESFANQILFKERALKIVSFVKWRIFNFKNIASTDTQIQLEKLDDRLNIFLSEIRQAIGERIQEMARGKK